MRDAPDQSRAEGQCAPLGLRMGIYSGPVGGVADVNARPNVGARRHQRMAQPGNGLWGCRSHPSLASCGSGPLNTSSAGGSSARHWRFRG